MEPASTSNVSQNKDYIAFGSCLNLTLENDKLYVSFRNEGEYGATWSRRNTVCCADVELHRVQDLVGFLPSPWREMSWTDTTRESLRKEFVSYKLPTNYPVSQVKALVLGPVGSGKSCFINSVRSAMYKRIVHLPNVGTAVKGFTNKFQPDAPATDDVSGYKKDPSNTDKIQCVLFVLDAYKLESYPSGLKSTLRKLIATVSELGIPQLILLSHVDQVCPAVQKDLMYVYLSRDVQEKMEKAAELVGLPVSYVLPVKNYVSQLTVDCNTDILLLSAVMNILQAVDDTMEDQYPSLTVYDIREGKGSSPTVLSFSDVLAIGDDDSIGLSLADALSVIKGHIPIGYKFQPDAPATDDVSGYKKDPSNTDKIQCVLFVLDAYKLESYPSDLKSTLRKLNATVSELGIPQLILLSHVDQVCPAVQKDLMYVYLSRDVQEKMEKAAELVGLPVSYVLPVKNYVSQLTVDCNTDILLLSAVMNILQAVDDTMEDQYPSVIPCIPMM